MPFELRKSKNKKPFPVGPEVDFKRQHSKSSFRSNLNICRLNFENPSNSSRFIGKKPFLVQTGSRFSARKFVSYHCYQTWIYAVWISKVCLLVFMLWAKSLFPSEPEVYFQRQKFSVITAINLNICRLNIENPSISYLVMRKNFALSEPEEDFQRQQFSVIHSIKPEHKLFEFWKSVK